MFLFPGFITPMTAIVVYVPLIVLPVVFVIWFVRKLNSIDETLREILEKIKNN